VPWLIAWLVLEPPQLHCLHAFHNQQSIVVMSPKHQLHVFLVSTLAAFDSWRVVVTFDVFDD